MYKKIDLRKLTLINVHIMKFVDNRIYTNPQDIVNPDSRRPPTRSLYNLLFDLHSN